MSYVPSDFPLIMAFQVTASSGGPPSSGAIVALAVDPVPLRSMGSSDANVWYLSVVAALCPGSAQRERAAATATAEG
jgi:hypothetical protein